jgi:hypothetical protein
VTEKRGRRFEGREGRGEGRTEEAKPEGKGRPETKGKPEAKAKAEPRAEAKAKRPEKK